MTTNAPFLGLSSLITTFAAFPTPACILAARVLNAPQDLQCSMVTILFLSWEDEDPTTMLESSLASSADAAFALPLATGLSVLALVFSALLAFFVLSDVRDFAMLEMYIVI